jgi:histone H1/5
VKLVLKAGVKTGSLKQSKGTGARRSFKLGEKPRYCYAQEGSSKKPAAMKAARPKKPAAEKKAAATCPKKQQLRSP